MWNITDANHVKTTLLLVPLENTRTFYAPLNVKHVCFCLILPAGPADTTQDKPAAPVLDSTQAALFDPYKKPAENAAVASSFGLKADDGECWV